MHTNTRALLLAITLSVISLSASTSFADVISPSEVACDSKQPGDACDLGGGSQGVCKADQCCRPTPDGTEDCRTCNLCQEGTPTNNANNNTANNTTNTATNATTSTAGAETTTPPSTDQPPKNKGCAASQGPIATSLSSLLLGLLLLLGLRKR